MDKKVLIDTLYVDSAVDVEKIIKLLKENNLVVFIKKEGEEVQFAQNLSKFRTKVAILIYMLGKKVLYELEEIEDEAVSNSELVKNVGIIKNTLGKELSRMSKNKIILHRDTGYVILNSKIDEVLQLILEDVKNEK